MQCYEFEIMCRWVAARLRRMGMNIVERDPSFMDAVSQLELESVADAVRLSDAAISRIAERLGCEKRVDRRAA